MIVGVYMILGVLLAVLFAVLVAVALTWFTQYMEQKRKRADMEVFHLQAVEMAAKLACDAWRLQRSLTYDPATQNGWYECQEAKTNHAITMLALSRELGMPEPTVEREKNQP